MSRRIMVAGNWKMNGSNDSITSLLTDIKAGMDAADKTTVVVCPPMIYIHKVQELTAGTEIGVGAQNLSVETSGAFTGEMSSAMLTDNGCTYVIVGHSERRALYHEDDMLVAKKYGVARAGGLTPILCIGETLEEREAGITEQVVGRQLDAVIAMEGVSALADGVIAYEPVWAIGTGKTATPQQAQDVHAFIRARIASVDADVAAKVQILYGGSVKGSNAAELFANEDIDGGLIGGASLDAEDFLKICTAAN